MDKETARDLIFELVPEECLIATAEALTAGARKHGPGPIECIPFRKNDYFNKAKKKLKRWETGDLQNEDGFPNLAGAQIRLWQLMALDFGIVWPPPQKPLDKKEDY